MPTESQATDIRAALAAVLAAEKSVDDVHDGAPPEDAPADVHRDFERRADAATHAERIARDALISLLISASNSETSAVIIDGTIVTYSDSSDGLAIVPVDRIVNLLVLDG